MPPPCAKYDPVVFRSLFDLRAPSSTDVPVLLLNQPIMYGLTCKFSVLYNADLFTSSRNPNFLENGTDKISLHVKVRKLSKLERSRKRTTRMTSNKIQRTVMNSSSAYWSLHSTISIVALLQPHYTGFCGFVSVKRVTKRNTGVISLNTRSRLTLGGGDKTLGYAKSEGYPKCGILRSGDIQNNGNFDKEDNQNILILNCKA